MKNVVIGTAGHIDHGKSALIEALTGTHPDRLEEERRRGITIDLGFAFLKNSDVSIGFVDVPGHERFVRNMLAGVGGIDCVLLVIAADEGIKPQTREHFEICKLLEIPRGIVALTKSDLVDADTLTLAQIEIEDYLRGSFLESAPIVPVSARTGAGLENLRDALLRVASEVSEKNSSQWFRLPIDRAFAMKGFGTVVTGTLVSGAVAVGDEVELFPAGKRVRVRGIQSGGSSVVRASGGATDCSKSRRSRRAGFGARHDSGGAGTFLCDVACGCRDYAAGDCEKIAEYAFESSFSSRGGGNGC